MAGYLSLFHFCAVYVFFSRALTTINAYFKTIVSLLLISFALLSAANAQVFEVETINIFNDPGQNKTITNDGSASNGQWDLFESSSNGNFISYIVSGVAPGTYDLSVRMHTGSDHGIIQTDISEDYSTLTDVGGLIDLYSSSAGYQVYALGSVTFTGAASVDKYFTFEVEGKNPASSGRHIGSDYIELTLANGNTVDTPVISPNGGSHASSSDFLRITTES